MAAPRVQSLITEIEALSEAERQDWRRVSCRSC